MRRTLDFLLFDWLRAGELCARERFAEHAADTFAALLDSSELVSRERFAPLHRVMDQHEPRFDGERVLLPPGCAEALQDYAQLGLLGATQDARHGGVQLPCVIETAANAFFSRDNLALVSYTMLTRSNASLLLAHGTPAQRAHFAQPLLAGRWFGTMCLSEPQAGSSLADLRTRAEPDGAGFEQDPLGPRYRLFGHKMWISGGEHELAGNIVHLVLAKIPGDDGRLPEGTRGLSLFIVPKWLLDGQGGLSGVRNDVALAGLNHKLGYRGTSNCLLNFGEGRYLVEGRAGALGYRVGQPGEGLQAMFHMMNEARIAVGLGAATQAVAGYEASLAYARERVQGRPLGAQGKQAGQAPCAIIEHADVKRMLLAQKSYAEGGMALVLYAARLVDELRSGTPEAVREAGQLLEVLIPVVKSWPSEWGLEANSLAIQVLGGAGYTRDFPVEQFWRDNRLNMIHEGTHGIQALDLLGRKLTMDGGKALQALARRINASIERAGQVPGLAEPATQLAEALAAVGGAAQSAWATGDAEAALANATPFLQAFGHTVLAWLWLDIALTLDPQDEGDFAQGKRAAQRYFFAYELPKTAAWLAVVRRREALTREMRPAWF